MSKNNDKRVLRKFINYEGGSHLLLLILEIILISGWVEEEGPIGTHVAYVRAEDLDSLKNGQTNIRLLENKNVFQLADGILTTKIKLDREQTSEYQIVIEACDNGRKQK